MILKKEITIVGTGAVARALAVHLKRKGCFVTVIGRSKRNAMNLASTVSGQSYSLAHVQEKHFQNIVFIAVTDDAISDVIQLIWSKSKSLKGTTVFHLSGGLTSELLQPLKLLGGNIGSFHPMQTFPKGKTKENLFSGITVALEGDRKAIQAGKQLAQILGAKTIRLSAQKKALYHSAGIFASNYLVTLMSITRDIAVEAGIPLKKVWEVYFPLIQATMANVVSSSPEKALTGPIARGDIATVNRHLRALSRKKLKHLVPLYAALGIETARLAKKKIHAR